MTGVLSRYPEPGEDPTHSAREDRGLRTLATALGSSRNSLNALRLVFAAAVIVSHAWVLGGYGPEPALYGIKLGGASVMGFFAISGYLITLSAQRSRTVRDFVLARLTRIYPALFISALVVGFIAAPIGGMITRGHYSLEGSLLFVGFAVTLLIGVIGAPLIGTTLLGNPDSGNWNGPLWTLTWEVLCYVMVALVVFSLRHARGGGRYQRIATVFLFIVATGGTAAKILAGGFENDPREFALPLAATFLAGSILAQYRDHVPVGPVPALLAAGATWASVASQVANALAPLPLAYLVLQLGAFRLVARVGSRYDISYGVYIYGWPAQQLLAAAHVPGFVPPLAYAAMALAVVWPLAFLSCVCVEQPAQRWRRAWSQRGSGTARAAEAHQLAGLGHGDLAQSESNSGALDKQAQRSAG
ncbi:acyltransferase [Sinomonas albida]|uniref:acyltransferase family protein n=1 Tax=Sinomonas albida TaxID=369942 RepID=UPI0030166D17